MLTGSLENEVLSDKAQTVPLIHKLTISVRKGGLSTPSAPELCYSKYLLHSFCVCALNSCLCVPTCFSMWMEGRRQPWVLILRVSPPIFLRMGVFLAWNLPSRLVRLAIFFCLPSKRALPKRVFLYVGLWGLGDSGPHTSKASNLSSHLLPHLEAPKPSTVL